MKLLAALCYPINERGECGTPAREIYINPKAIITIDDAPNYEGRTRLTLANGLIYVIAGSACVTYQRVEELLA